MNARSTLVGFAASIIVLLGIHDAFAQDKSANPAFEALAKSYIEKLLEMEPERATWLGDHRFDDRLDDYTKEGVKRSRALSAETLKALDAIPAERLSVVNSIDYRILHTRLESAIFRADEIREHEWNPLVYNIAGAIYELIARDFAPLEVRLRSAAGRLKQVPEVVAAAKANLSRPPRIHTARGSVTQRPRAIDVEAEFDQFVAELITMAARDGNGRKRSAGQR